MTMKDLWLWACFGFDCGSVDEVVGWSGSLILTLKVKVRAFQCSVDEWVHAFLNFSFLIPSCVWIAFASVNFLFSLFPRVFLAKNLSFIVA